MDAIHSLQDSLHLSKVCIVPVTCHVKLTVVVEMHRFTFVLYQLLNQNGSI